MFLLFVQKENMQKTCPHLRVITDLLLPLLHIVFCHGSVATIRLDIDAVFFQLSFFSLL